MSEDQEIRDKAWSKINVGLYIVIEIEDIWWKNRGIPLWIPVVYTMYKMGYLQCNSLKKS